MAIHNFFQGGNASNRVTNSMFPSGTTPAACNPFYSYADHQRERAYGVTRDIDLRGVTPSGGGNRSHDALCYFGANPLAVGDVIRTHLLLPNTVLRGVSLGIGQALAGFTFSVAVEKAPLPLFLAVDAGVIVKNAAGCPLAQWRSAGADGLFIDDEDYVSMTVTGVPAAGMTGCGPAGVHMWLTAHVFDLNHGNA